LRVIPRNSLMMIDLYIPVKVLYLSKTASVFNALFIKIFTNEITTETKIERKVFKLWAEAQL